MKYESFKLKVKDEFISFLPEAYQGATADVRPVNKTNQRLDGLFVRDAGAGFGGSPVIYVNDMYREYLESDNFGAVMAKAAEAFVGAAESNPYDVSRLLNPDAAMGKVVFWLLNTEQNKEMLADMPHREFCDLSVSYRLMVSSDDDGIASAPVHGRLAEAFGMDEKKLFALAMENTRRLLPPVVRSMNDILLEAGLLGQPASLPGVPEMYVITNGSSLYGAASILYEDVLYALSEKLGSDLYILPSSIHEAIAIRADVAELDELAAIVGYVNANEVAPEDFLSGNVYFYDRARRKVALASTEG